MRSWFSGKSPSFEQQVADVVADPADRMTRASLLHELDDLLGLTEDDGEESAEGAGESRKVLGAASDVEEEVLDFGIGENRAEGECLDGMELSQYLSTGQLSGERQKHLDECPLCETVVACAKANVDRVNLIAAQLASPAERAEDPNRQVLRELRERQRASVRANLQQGYQFKVIDASQPQSVRSPSGVPESDSDSWDWFGAVARPAGFMVLGSALTLAYLTRSSSLERDKFDVVADTENKVLSPVQMKVAHGEAGVSHDFTAGQQAKVMVTGNAEVVATEGETVQWEVADATLSAEPVDPGIVGSPDGDGGTPTAAAE